jgi:DNA (cytosine-5)-methyltransferase 1
MPAYYNEIDAFAAAWLRELIARNLIAPGDVDERSIEIVRPADLTGYTQCHFFAGIGVWSHALRSAGWSDDRPVWTGSCPCQPFSAAGKGDGFSDERHLWPVWYRLISECRPGVVFGEQVAERVGPAWLDLVHADMEAAGYAVGALDLSAAGLGAPHRRQRFFFVADAASERWAARELPRPHLVSDGLQSPQCGAADRMAHPDCRGSSTGRIHRRREATEERTGRTAPGHCVAGELAHAEGDGRIEGQTESAWIERRSDVGERSATGFLADTDVSKQGRGELGLHSQDRSGDGAAAIGELTNGFWADAEWLACSDGKARPVEPGSFPLAHGAPARVGRLRGYGNAIVAPQAAAFIEAYLDVAGK